MYKGRWGRYNEGSEIRVRLAVLKPACTKTFHFVCSFFAAHTQLTTSSKASQRTFIIQAGTRLIYLCTVSCQFVVFSLDMNTYRYVPSI